MAYIAGVDGCPGGWLCIALDTETEDLNVNIFPTASQLMSYNQKISVLAIDMPIGLTDSGFRKCDEFAKKILGIRHMCVFFAPTRSALFAPSRIAAERIVGRGISVQEWNIYPKIINLDSSITSAEQNWFLEVHPEISFWAWNNKTIIQYKKSSPEGLRIRETLIDSFFPNQRLQVSEMLKRNGNISRKFYQTDDINDAFAALWTAKRILTNKAKRIPQNPEEDSCGLRMEIWY